METRTKIYTDSELAEAGMTREQYEKAKQHAVDTKAIVEAAKKLKEAMEKSATYVSLVTVTHADVNYYYSGGWHTLRTAEN